MKNNIIPREAVKALRGFSPDLPDRTIPELKRLLGRDDVIKLSFNESPYGPSPKVLSALTEAATQTHLYHDPEGKELKAAIAENFSVESANVFLANGADEVISLIAQAFLSAGDEAIVVHPSFGQYGFGAKLMGAEPVAVPVKPDMTADLAAMAAAITDKTKVIFVCNPNNPTGVIIPGSELIDFLAKVPANVIVVLDEAYAEYVEDEQYLSGLDVVKQYPNVITVRTFSKIYGLAGLRLGYGFAHPGVTELIDRVRSPFNVNSLAQAAALAALADEAYCERIAALNKAERHRVTRELENLGYTVYPSQTNFLFVDTGADSEIMCRFLAEKGIIIRPGSNWNLPNCVRITLGNSLQNDKLLERVKQFA